jgi:hypothetical protein
MSDKIRSELPFLPDASVRDVRLEDATLNLVGMCGTIDPVAGVSRLDSPATSEPYPEYAFRNVVAFGHFRSISEEGMQGPEPARFYRIYLDGYAIDLRHYPCSPGDMASGGGEAGGFLSAMADPLVIVGALDPLARKEVRQLLGMAGIMPCRIEEQMFEERPEEPLSFDNLVRQVCVAFGIVPSDYTRLRAVCRAAS